MVSQTRPLYRVTELVSVALYNNAISRGIYGSVLSATRHALRGVSDVSSRVWYAIHRLL